MKNKTLLMMVLALMFGFKGYSQLKSNDTLQRTMEIPGIPDGATVAIDGKSDEGFWGKIPFQECKRDITNAWMIADLDSVRPTANMYVKYKCAYDANNLYFFAEVKDDALVSWSQVKNQTFAMKDGTTGKTEPYHCDNIELYTLFAPAGTVEGPWSLTYASQLRMWPDLNPTPFSEKITGGGWSASIENPGALGYVTSTVKTETGYTFEARIPFAVIVPPADVTDAVLPVEGNTIFFDLNPADRDVVDIGTTEEERGGRERTTIHSWNSRWNRDWGFTDYYGLAKFTAKLTDAPVALHLDIPGVPANVTPVIDGKASEGFWSLVPEQTIAKDVTNAWTVDGMVPYTSTDNYGMKFKVAYDANNMYFFADVTDNELVSWSQVKNQTFAMKDGTTGKTEPYHCDNIELYTLFAPAGTVEGPWSLTYASQLRMWPDLNPTPFSDKITGGGWSASIENPGALGYVTSTVKTATGYTFEARIPFAVIVPPADVTDAVQPVTGNTIFFDVNPADRDVLDIGTTEEERAGRERTFIGSWSADWSRDWGFTDYYGTATFKDKINNVGINTTKTNSVKVYPTVCTSSIKLENLSDANNVISICNVAGQKVLSQNVKNSYVTLNVEDLKSGMYLVTVNGKVVSKIIKK